MISFDPLINRSLINKFIEQESSQDMLNVALKEATERFVQANENQKRSHFQFIIEKLLQKGVHPGSVKIWDPQVGGEISLIDYLMKHGKIGLARKMLFI